MASLCCLSVWPPSCSISARATISFWLCEPCWPGLCLLVTDPLCPHCLQLVRPLRAADYPTVIGAWALSDQRCPADCGALVIFHSLMLRCPRLLACSSVLLCAWPLMPRLWTKRLDVCQLNYVWFSHKKWQGWAVLFWKMDKLSLWRLKFWVHHKFLKSVHGKTNWKLKLGSSPAAMLCPAAMWYTSNMCHAGFKFFITLFSLLSL